MTKKRLNILLTNDDGFNAEGIQALYREIQKIATVSIVAPDRERSAVGHGITMHSPLRVTPVSLETEKHWQVDGTPSDCVKIGVEKLLPNKPDLVLSGINCGPNLGNDVLYSGTVSAAIEGFFCTIPSIAFSLTGFCQLNYTPVVQYIGANLFELWELAKKAILNINFPVVDSYQDFKGVRLTKLGQRLYENVFEERKDPRGRSYYWMGGEPVIFEQDHDSDIAAVEKGYISITPIKSDLTDLVFLKDLSNSFLGKI